MTQQEITDALFLGGYSRRQGNGQAYMIQQDRKDPTRFILGASSRTTVFTSDKEKAAAMRQQQIERRTKILTDMAAVLTRAGANVEVVRNGELPVQIIVKNKPEEK